MTFSGLVSASCAFVVATSASAVVVPFTETFNAGPVGWRDAGGGALAGWVGAGGPDASAYITQNTNVNNANTGVVIALRASAAQGASGGAFAGNWLSEGVTSFSYAVRHNAPMPISVAARFAGPANFPGAVAINFAPVLPGVWTTLTFSISPANPQFVTFEGSDFATVFASVSNVQLAYSVPAALAGTGTQIQFDADNAAIVPSPGATLVLAGFPLGMLIRRRR